MLLLSYIVKFISNNKFTKFKLICDITSKYDLIHFNYNLMNEHDNIIKIKMNINKPHTMLLDPINSNDIYKMNVFENDDKFVCHLYNKIIKYNKLTNILKIYYFRII